MANKTVVNHPAVNGLLYWHSALNETHGYRKEKGAKSQLDSLIDLLVCMCFTVTFNRLDKIYCILRLVDCRIRETIDIDCTFTWQDLFRKTTIIIIESPSSLCGTQLCRIR